MPKRRTFLEPQSDPVDVAAFRCRRFWVPRGTAPDLSDDGYLVDPESPHSIDRGVSAVPFEVFDRSLMVDALTVEGDIFIDHTNFLGPLTLSSLDVKGLLKISGSSCGQVLLQGSKIGALGIVQTVLSGPAEMQHIHVVRDVVLDRADFKSELNLSFAEVGSNVNLDGGSFASTVDLSGARIQGYLSLGGGTRRAKWSDTASLSLLNATLGAMQDREDGWPKEVELVGLTYRQWGAFAPFILESKEGSSETKPVDLSTFANRDVSWFKEWLSRQNYYSTQPYTQLAALFNQVGEIDKAKTILYAAKDRECRNTTGFPRLFCVFSKLFIGYGYHLYYSLYWCFGFIILGVLVLRITGEHKKHEIPLGFFFSLDMFLPFIQLRKRHFDIDLDGLGRYYFYMHRIMGYVLGSFLLAGLAGITK